MMRNLGYVPVLGFRSTSESRCPSPDLHSGEARLSNQCNLGGQERDAFQPTLEISYASSIIICPLPRPHTDWIAALVTPSEPVLPTRREYNDDHDLNAELELELLSVVEDAPPKRSSARQEPSSLNVPPSSAPNGASGSQPLLKKSMIKHRPKPKPKAQLFMNPNSAAAMVANKKSASAKQEPKVEQKSSVSSQPAPPSKLNKLVRDVKGKGVKRGLEPEVEESAKIQKRLKPSPQSSKTQPQSRPQASKPPPLAAGLPPKPQFTAVPPQPQPKPQPPAKKGFNLELPTGPSAGSSSNPLLAGGGGGVSLSLPTGTSTTGGTQPPPPALVDTTPAELSDSESEWDVVDADGPSPLSHQSQPQSEPQPFRLGSLTIEEDPPAGFSAKLDIIDGDGSPYGDDRDADGEGEDIDMDNLMAELAEELQSGDGGEQEGEGDLNDLNEMEDFSISAVSEQDQEGYQDGDMDNDVGGDMFGDDDSSSSSEDSDD